MSTRVLVVDDDVLVARAITVVLARGGFDVRSAIIVALRGRRDVFGAITFGFVGHERNANARRLFRPSWRADEK